MVKSGPPREQQLFIVKTEDGSVYTGRLNTPETPAGQPVKIQIVETQERLPTSFCEVDGVYPAKG
jgi:hypothetical protein